MKTFLCHNSDDSAFVIEVAQYLRRNVDVFYFEDYQRADQSFLLTINREITESEVMVIFVGAHFSEYQEAEANAAYRLHMAGRPRSFFTVRLPGPDDAHYPFPDTIQTLGTYPQLLPHDTGRGGALQVAAEILRRLGQTIKSVDDLPLSPHLFSYEKDVLDFFARMHQLGNALYTEQPPFGQWEERDRLRKQLLDGCPTTWPMVVHWEQEDPENENLLIPEIGDARPDDARVLCKALFTDSAAGVPANVTAEVEAGRQHLYFPEAGPRQQLYYPRPAPTGGRSLNVAVLVSGGIAPGINAVIDGIVQRHWLYAKRHGWADGLKIYGIRNGFLGLGNLADSYLLAADRHDYAGGVPHSVLVTSDHISEGGSILGTARVDELIDPSRRLRRLRDVDDQLRLWGTGIDILYVIGGDGSMKAAHALWSVAQANESRQGPDGRQLSVVAIPKTMDNDILWVWQAFGFLSAVEKAREFIEQLRTEVTSNPRLCVVQLFGSDSGFVVSHAVLASGTGHCQLALIPEVEFSMDTIAEYLARVMCQGRPNHIPLALVVMSETAIPTDALRYTGDYGDVANLQPDELEHRYEVELRKDEKTAIREYEMLRCQGGRIQGQTNDALRTACLRIVSEGLRRRLQKWPMCNAAWSKLRVFTSEPRHLLRAIAPSSSDIIIGQRLGTLAVDNAMAGYTDFMISQWLTEFVLVPLKLVTLGRKRVPKNGIFWRSVRAKTGQPESLTRTGL